MSYTLAFQVLENLAWTADVQAAKLVRHQGVSKEGKAYDFTRWEAPITFEGVEVGLLTSPDIRSRVCFHEGKYKPTKVFKWKYSDWQSLNLNSIKKEYGEKFYEEDVFSEKTKKTNHVVGYSKKEGTKEITLWVYTNLYDKDTDTYRVHIEMKATAFVDPKTVK